MKSIERNIDLRRYLNWSRIVKGKPIHIRLYELIYYDLLMISHDLPDGQTIGNHREVRKS